MSGLNESVDLGEWRTQLHRIGCQPYFEDAGNGRLIIGRTGWAPDRLREFVRAHAGRELRVYSQEMMLALLSTRHDPLDATSDEILALWGDHPALRFLADDVEFDWPQLLVSDSGDHGIPGGFADIGIRSVFGHSAGRDARTRRSRRAALARAYAQPVPADGLGRLSRRAGAPKSSTRRRRIAFSMATQIRLDSEKTTADMSLALLHWQDDLEWLRETYYEPCDPSFTWPTVSQHTIQRLG